jgi:zinc transport system ATP-binding protein
MNDAVRSGAVFQVQAGTVALGGEDVLSNIDLSVAPGQFLALLGGNGSGKSTLLRALLGLQPLSAGVVRIFGTPAERFRDWSRIAYVPQHLLASSAVPVSVSEVVGAGLTGRRPSWRRPDPARVRSSLEQVGLWSRRKDSFHHLSGGQQRRAMIAAALAKQAEVLMLDEPTAGVDAENVATLARIFAEQKAEGTTIILVTHELGAMQPLVDRCLVLGGHGDSSIRYDGPAPMPTTMRDPHGHHDDESARSTGWEFRA